jgi:2-succinyl-5-enolpyruvyl-6-hydroxy-3-cyclohexene-1-carboxylate synthase
MVVDPNRNARWCRLIAEELHRAGAAHAVLCPGSRNSPLLFALATAFGDQAHSHIDERSAGFIALGLAKASDAPAVVCVTSGSAVVNLLPAIVEALSLIHI